ncbi:hypothetical protein [Helicobacter sp. MIT 01-3238]|uniref:hypothetical protein n=1 Tax=Helicobacter sp. MIT 01-3238 TaxID=398627 RepID=UPI000E1E7ED1|nr:hypothetical protein [Helicobacter sp. MIT 01-3238]RDU55199.1 hypothetical protein CQA40_01875 [Helicobacter sp. MIT 01-3238]
MKNPLLNFLSHKTASNKPQNHHNFYPQKPHKIQIHQNLMQKRHKHTKALHRSAKNAFILLDFVLAMSILSLIIIALMQASAHFQRQNLAKSTQHLKGLEASNAIDIVRNLLEMHSSIDFSHDMLKLDNHIIWLDSHTLLLDNSPILHNVFKFSITPQGQSGFSISLCYATSHAKQSCISKAGFFSTIQPLSTDKNQTSSPKNTKL